MMSFEDGPLMPDSAAKATGHIICASQRPEEVDLMLSLVDQLQSIALDDYREPELTRRAG